MTVLLAILISGVLLDSKDVPMPKYQLAFTSPDGKVINVTTGENGKFRVNLAPGTYYFQFGVITVDKKTSRLKLKASPQPPAKPPEPHIIEVIRNTQGDVILPKGPRG